MSTNILRNICVQMRIKVSCFAYSNFADGSKYHAMEELLVMITGGRTHWIRNDFKTRFEALTVPIHLARELCNLLRMD